LIGDAVYARLRGESRGESRGEKETSHGFMNDIKLKIAVSWPDVSETFFLEDLCSATGCLEEYEKVIF
jgi:hypothetical protein